MSGHSKFANIKHKKEKNDAKKGKIFTVKRVPFDDATITPTVALSIRTMTTSMINRFLLFLIIFGSSYTSLLVVMLSREMSPR